MTLLRPVGDHRGAPEWVGREHRDTTAAPSRLERLTERAKDLVAYTILLAEGIGLLLWCLVDPLRPVFVLLFIPNAVASALAFRRVARKGGF